MLSTMACGQPAGRGTVLERITSAAFAFTCPKEWIIQVYAVTNDETEEEKEDFKQYYIYDRTPEMQPLPQNVKSLMFNTKTGNQYADMETTVIGQPGLDK